MPKVIINFEQVHGRKKLSTTHKGGKKVVKKLCKNGNICLISEFLYYTNMLWHFVSSTATLQLLLLKIIEIIKKN